MSYEHDKDAQNCLAQLDSIINHVLEHKQTVHNLARVAIDKYIYYGDSIFVDKLTKACVVLNLPNMIKTIQYILGKGNVRMSRKTGALILLHKEEAKRAFYAWDKSKTSFEETAKQAEEYAKEEKTAMKQARKQEEAETSLSDFQEQIHKNIEKLLKKDTIFGEKAEFLKRVLMFIELDTKQCTSTQDRANALPEKEEQAMIADAQEVAQQQDADADDIIISN